MRQKFKLYCLCSAAIWHTHWTGMLTCICGCTVRLAQRGGVLCALQGSCSPPQAMPLLCWQLGDARAEALRGRR